MTRNKDMPSMMFNPLGWGGATLIDWMDGIQRNDDPEVCITHMRFVPCRHAEPGSLCRRSTKQSDVETVRVYQAAP